MPISSPSRSEKPQTTCAHPLSPARSGIRRNRICGITAYLGGYGPTRFIDAETSRSGQQAALAADLHELIAALGVTAPVVAGFDWGGLRHNEYPIHTEIMAARGRRTAPAAAKATACGL